jgi:hypothetical protein
MVKKNPCKMQNTDDWENPVLKKIPINEGILNSYL